MEHRNIHQLMGVIVFKDQYLGMVSEWMENGHLHKYLRNHPDADRYQLCIDVASGLEYMHSNSAWGPQSYKCTGITQRDCQDKRL
ncbi:tyrosine kinase domain protein [Rhizoctonia solani AG-3 Rhs1AP]|uniref:Tyrosine kinase domain protein n=1 Tax=Rhizoctonia solani AG-3 Rhs1AP TaxID=1086054 RepID=X8J474_9AGAM|nr:tyrosine kinase domain protein [Rhizoctonia solani AG-3 Rhs1AP]